MEPMDGCPGLIALRNKNEKITHVSPERLPSMQGAHAEDKDTGTSTPRKKFEKDSEAL
jgi:hypothetical protein